MAPGQRRLSRMGGSRHAGVASRGTPTEPTCMIGEHHPSSVQCRGALFNATRANAARTHAQTYVLLVLSTQRAHTHVGQRSQRRSCNFRLLERDANPQADEEQIVGTRC